MSKVVIPCPKCNSPLSFRQWSKRNGEALAFCNTCGEKWQVRMDKNLPTCEPYQVKQPAKKTARGSYKLEEERMAAIKAIYGSVQNFLDTCPLVSMPLQYKT